jgi:hypothetical protein
VSSSSTDLRAASLSARAAGHGPCAGVGPSAHGQQDESRDKQAGARALDLTRWVLLQWVAPLSGWALLRPPVDACRPRAGAVAAPSRDRRELSRPRSLISVGSGGPKRG